MQEKQLETSGKAWAESQLEPVNPIGLQQGAKPEKNNTAGFSSSGVFLGQGVGLFWSQQSAPALGYHISYGYEWLNEIYALWFVHAANLVSCINFL